MNYREDRYGNKLSQLGYGCMRFTKKGTGIDLDKTEKEIMYAYEKGINYFDTAYIYPGSEEALGEILNRNHIREKVNIATKLPQYIMKNEALIEKNFNEELKRLKTDYIDYYLMHMFTDYSEWEHLKSIGIESWIKAKKESGQVRQVGFSYHGDSDMFIKILNAYDWDFCQIQYNYLDENSQAGRVGLEAAHAKGIPVIIMEPLRGGKLVNLPEAAKKLLKESRRKFTAPELSFRWLWDQEGVSVILSGMNSIEMIDENIKTASDAKSGDLTAEDFELVDKVKKIIKEKELVGCTGCRYCMPCPKGVDIPGNFFFYNLTALDGKTAARFEYARAIGVRKDPAFASQCIGCGKCEKHCPQHLPIREMLKKADKALRPLPYKVGINVARKIMLKG
ncbi:MAG: aldo/keto reductase [Lachnospiraceae bacterium]|nr:aldo/keto reductase [Lachnospiraceae bacterium]